MDYQSFTEKKIKNQIKKKGEDTKSKAFTQATIQNSLQNDTANLSLNKPSISFIQDMSTMIEIPEFQLKNDDMPQQSKAKKKKSKFFGFFKKMFKKKGKNKDSKMSKKKVKYNAQSKSSNSTSKKGNSKSIKVDFSKDQIFSNE